MKNSPISRTEYESLAAAAGIKTLPNPGFTESETFEYWSIGAAVGSPEEKDLHYRRQLGWLAEKSTDAVAPAIESKPAAPRIRAMQEWADDGMIIRDAGGFAIMVAQ